MRKANTPYRNGPLYLIKRGNTFHIQGTANGRRIRVATNSDDLRRAKSALDDFVARIEGAWWRDEGDDGISWKDVAYAICARHRHSARARGIPFDLTAAEIYNALHTAGFRCAVSGIPLSRRIGPNNTVPDPWSASIDRIESRHGYTLDNFRVVCLAANLAMNRWGFDTLLRLSRGVLRNSAVTVPENLAHPLNNEPQQGAQVIDISSRTA